MRLSKSKLLATLAALILLGACASHTGGTLEPRSNGRIEGVVVDFQGRPVPGATIVTPPALQTAADGEGRFAFRHLPPRPRLPLRFQAPGFRSTTRLVTVTADRATVLRIVLQQQAAPIDFDAARGGEFSFADTGQLTIPPGSLVDRSGRRATGSASVRLTPIDLGIRDGLLTAPGDFSGRLADGSIVQLESFGMVDIAIESPAGEPLELAPGATAALAIPIPERLRASAPPEVGLYRFEPAEGRWIEEGELTRDEQGLTYTGSIDSVAGAWNADDPIETTCITVRVLDLLSTPPNQPAVGMTVEATGVNYGSVSTGQTNSEGLVCLLVKRNEPIELRAWSPWDPNRVSPPQTVTSPDIASGADACGDCFDCPPVATLLLDLIVGLPEDRP